MERKESVCRVTGGSCDWVWEDFFDDFGEVEASEYVCKDCGRYKSSVVAEDQSLE